MNRQILSRAMTLGAIATLPTLALAQTPTVVIREGDTLGGMTRVITSLSNPDVNTVGGFGLSLNLDDAGTTKSVIWGNPASASVGGASVLREEQLGLAGYDQVSFESFWGLADDGSICYGPGTTLLAPPMTTGLDAVWIDDMPLGVEGEPFLPEPGNVYRFNSRPNIIKTTAEPVWIAGVDDSTGTDVGRRLMRGTTPAVVVGSGQTFPAPSGTIQNSGVDFDFRFSTSGNHYILALDSEISSASGNYIFIDGAIAQTPSGTPIGDGQVIPIASGGDGIEEWDNFDSLGINENGDFMITGDTINGSTASDEFISFNGEIILREGDMVMDAGGTAYTLAGSIDYAYMNESGDIACAWDIDSSGNEAILVNGQVILKEGDEVDWDGDGVIDPGFIVTTSNGFTGLNAIVVGPRMGGIVRVYVVADIDDPMAVRREGLLCLEVPVMDDFTEFCNGDGGDGMGCTDCPCGNNALAGTIGGCLNSNGTSARLLASGSASMMADTLRFEVNSATSTTFGILSSAMNQLPNMGVCPPGSGILSPVLDGLRCVGGGLIRHGTRPTDTNGDIGVTTNGWGPPNGPAGGLVAQTGAAIGQTRNFQCFYREDVLASCQTGQNTTNAVSVVIAP